MKFISLVFLVFLQINNSLNLLLNHLQKNGIIAELINQNYAAQIESN